MCATAPSKPWKRTTAHAVSEPMRGVGKKGAASTAVGRIKSVPRL